MPIDPGAAIGAELDPVRFAWTPSDAQLYHLAVGAGTDPVSATELRYLDDREPLVLPTFATVAATMHVTEPPRVRFPGIDIDLSKVVHGSQEVVLHRPIPAAGEAVTTIRIADVWDKGTAAVIVQESSTEDAAGQPLWTARSSIFARGEGGFGGERGPSDQPVQQDRAPDLELLTPTLPQQALLYRMCGDRNPLHSSPEFARAAGFPRPILHGLCTYGIVCKALIDAAGYDTSTVTGFRAKFAGIVLPGETLRTRAWHTDDGLTAVTDMLERSAPALAQVRLSLL